MNDLQLEEAVSAAGFTAGDMADQGARQFEAGYAAAKAEQRAAAQESFVMVPVEPTEDMLMFMGGHDDAAARRAYALMLASRPQGASDA